MAISLDAGTARQIGADATRLGDQTNSAQVSGVKVGPGTPGAGDTARLLESEIMIARQSQPMSAQDNATLGGFQKRLADARGGSAAGQDETAAYKQIANDISHVFPPRAPMVQPGPNAAPPPSSAAASGSGAPAPPKPATTTTTTTSKSADGDTTTTTTTTTTTAAAPGQKPAGATGTGTRAAATPLPAPAAPSGPPGPLDPGTGRQIGSDAARAGKMIEAAQIGGNKVDLNTPGVGDTLRTLESEIQIARGSQPLDQATDAKLAGFQKRLADARDGLAQGKDETATYKQIVSDIAAAFPPSGTAAPAGPQPPDHLGKGLDGVGGGALNVGGAVVDGIGGAIWHVPTRAFDAASKAVGGVGDIFQGKFGEGAANIVGAGVDALSILPKAVMDEVHALGKGFEGLAQVGDGVGELFHAAEGATKGMLGLSDEAKTT